MFPLVRGEFLNRNLLFDDELRIVGLVDWESAAAAPAEAFAARTCMYRGWDGAVEGGYKVEVEAVEGGRKDLGRVLGGVLGELAVAMWVHEMGVDGIGYTEVLERAKGSRVRFGGGEGVDVVLGGGEMEGL